MDHPDYDHTTLFIDQNELETLPETFQIYWVKLLSMLILESKITAF